MTGSIGRLRRLTAVAGVAGVAVATLGSIPAAHADGAADASAATAARSFLGRYVLSDGRAVRRDQGGDTVAAGQAQALLLTVAVGDRRRFSTVWRWTRTHIVRRDGLLASHWRGGRVVNASSASDADLDTARALVLAGKRFGVRDYRVAGLRVARAVLRRETAVVNGQPVLLGGTWGGPGSSASINPSYNAPRTYEQLGTATGDRRFAALDREARRINTQLMASAPGLPPDWAVVNADGTVVPSSIPGRRSSTPRFSFDAARLPIRYAEACSAADRAVAAAPWTFFSNQAPESIGTAYGLDGTVLNSAQTVVTTVAAAAAAQAAGRQAARDALLAQATTVDAAFPTYYGAAWLALGRIALTTRLLGGCAA
jgi:endoglucanase